MNHEKQAAAHLARQKAPCGQASPPDRTFVLSEACLRQTMGDPTRMADQLRLTLDLSNRPPRCALRRNALVVSVCPRHDPPLDHWIKR
ncbi:Scr1 family TA system antitoxin-like transcriptional regulator [Nonomuraea sp. NPDC050547]|uniref:Scr1 family TA system antitoxin-like transcriptional regulator n=1 Tax=Nonomuraea sp. NPDC050547 TaxID=3364368 RepID=UPI0037A80A61